MFHYSFFNHVMAFLAFSCLTYSAAFFIFIAIENPFANMINLLIKGKK